MAESTVYRGGRVNLAIPQQRAYEAEAIERGLGQVDAAVRRMTAFFQQQAEKKAVIEGEEYGAANAPTLEQIQDARSAGKELALPGNKNTIFGRAARQSAIDVTSANIELAARTKMNEIVLNYERSQKNPANLQNDLDAVILGYASTFDETSPSSARALQARLAMSANGAYSSYTSSYITKMRENAKAATMQNIITGFDAYANLYKSGIEHNGKKYYPGESITMQINGQPVTASVEDIIKQTMMENALQGGLPASTIASLANMHDEAMRDAALEIINDAALNQGTLYRQEMFYQDLSLGNLENAEPHVQAAFNSLSNAKDRQTAIDFARNRWMDSIQDVEKRDAYTKSQFDVLKRAAQTQSNLLLDLYITATTDGTSSTTVDNTIVGQGFYFEEGQSYSDGDILAAYEASLEELRQYDPVGAQTLLDAVSKINFDGIDFTPAPTDDVSALMEIEQKLDEKNPTLTLASLDRYFFRKEISVATYRRVGKELRARRDPAFNEMVQAARDLTPLPPAGMFATFNTDQQIHIRRLNDFKVAARRARDADPRGFNPMLFLEMNKDMLLPPEVGETTQKINDIKAQFPTLQSLNQAINTSKGQTKINLTEDKKFMLDNKGY